jgi:hypothetical protein
MIKLKFYHHLKTLLAITVLLMISATTAQAQKVTQKGILKLNSYKTEDFSYYGITGPITQSDELYSKGVIYFDFMSGTDEYLAFEDFRQFTRSGKLRLPSSIASDFKFFQIYPEKEAVPGTNNTRPANITYTFEVYNDELVDGQLSLFIKNDGASDDFWLDDDTFVLQTGGIVLEPGKVNLISVQVVSPPEYEASGELQVLLSKEGGGALTDKEKVTIEQIGSDFSKTVNSLSDIAQFNQLPFGAFRITIDNPKFEPVSQTISIQPGNPKASVSISLNLKRFPLKIRTNADTYSIDVTDPETNRLVGNNSVRSVRGESVFDLPAGIYRLVATANGYDQEIKTVELSPKNSEGQSINIRMKKQSGPVASNNNQPTPKRIESDDKGGLGWLWIALGAGAAGGAYYFISAQGGGSGSGYGSPPALPTPSN